MSHELRTPMNGLLGMTELLMMSEVSEQQEEYLRTMNQSGQALLTIINDILDFSKISVGKMRMEPQPCNIAILIYDVASLLYGQAQAKGVELLVSYPSGVPAGLLVDSGRLRQVLTNIIGNAIKFTDHGHVLVDVAMGEENGITIAIRDSGVGMSEAELSSIFDTFVQVDRSISRRQTGTGLGLAISKRIVEMMGSELLVSSKPGVGSTFSFTLHLESAEVLSAVDQRLLSKVPQGLEVLILDDNRMRSEVFAGLCNDLGMTAKAYSNLKDLTLQLQIAQPSYLFLHSGCFADREALDVQLRLIRSELGYRNSIVLVAPRVSLEDGLPTQVDSLLAGFLQPNHILRSAIERAGTKTHHRLRAISPESSVKSPPSEALVPKQPSGVEQPDEIAPSDDIPSAINVLVVDDNKVNRTLLRHQVKRLKLTFLEAENGQEALDLMKEQRFELILMDCAMPIKDGYQATTEIRSWEDSHGEERRHIIAVTAHAMEGERERCLSAGMDDHLTKPIKADALLPVLEAHCTMT